MGGPVGGGSNHVPQQRCLDIELLQFDDCFARNDEERVDVRHLEAEQSLDFFELWSFQD